MAGGEAAMGLISVVALFELYYRSGFAIGFWGPLTMSIGLVITLTGFATYRYRETRAITMAQLFEVRYSKRFRVFAGLLAWVSGVLNDALFPAPPSAAADHAGRRSAAAPGSSCRRGSSRR